MRRKMTLKKMVVLDTTKVQIFKQITTLEDIQMIRESLFQIPQRYRFSSKSQQLVGFSGSLLCCFRYHKGTDFQANHNCCKDRNNISKVVLDTTKVQIFKQITTLIYEGQIHYRCFRYHKGTDFQANHNDYGRQ